MAIPSLNVSISLLHVDTSKGDGNTPCGCHLKCFETVAEPQRKRLFEGFWKTADFNIQNAYICGCVKVVEVSKPGELNLDVLTQEFSM